MAVEDFWPEFGDENALREESCTSYGSLAEYVLNYFGIRCNSGVGGSLEDLDIKHLDAMQVVKLSLMQASADDGRIYEPIMQPDGSVDFRAIGEYTGLSGGDIYYEIQTGYFRERCSGVMVTGGTPLVTRKPTAWKPVWDENSHEIIDTGAMHSSCVEGDFNQWCTIVYNDPHLDSRYEDGIDNLYEITKDNPWDRIIGYAYFLDGWDEGDPDVSVEQQSTAKIVQRVSEENVDMPELGTLQNRPKYDVNENPDCYEGQGTTPPFSAGVEVTINPKFRYESVRGVLVDKFLGIDDVYVIGRKIQDLRGKAKTPSASLLETPAAADVIRSVTINASYDELIRLERGKDYTIVYEGVGTDKRASIVFSNNSRILDPADWGTAVDFFLDRDCNYYMETGQAEQTGSILPTADTAGILVKEIWCSMTINTPSITIYHPDGADNKARQIAESLNYQLTPMVVTEEPAPIAFNGSLIDQSQALPDHDPTTAQDFDNTDFERALDDMDQGGGLSITCSFLDDDGVEKLSGALYDYMNSGDGTESTYVCGPDTEVELGGSAPNGGVVNAINYSYQDSNSYTISVTAGQRLLGDFAQVDGGVQFKRAEDVPAQGTVIADMGNHIYYKVRLNGVGDRTAINMQPDIIRVGDIVSCTIYNNPVEA